MYRPNPVLIVHVKETPTGRPSNQLATSTHDFLIHPGIGLNKVVLGMCVCLIKYLDTKDSSLNVATGISQRYCGFGSRLPRGSMYRNKASHIIFWFSSAFKNYAYTLVS